MNTKNAALIVIVCIATITSCHDDNCVLGGDYVYSNGQISKLSGTGPYRSAECVIMNEVVNFNFDNDFIIAYQRPDRDWVDFEEDLLTNESIDSLETLYARICQIDHCYWIIRKSDDLVLGPLEKIVFEEKCSELNVKIKLDARYESAYHPIWPPSDTVVLGRYVPAELVSEGFKEKEYYMTLGSDRLSTFSCIFGIQDDNVKYARIAFDDSSKSCFAHVASDSAMLSTSSKEYSFFPLSYSQLITVFSHSMKKANYLFYLSGLSSLTIDMAYLGDEAINISEAYHAQIEGNPGDSTEEVMADVIRESRLYKDLNAVLNEHHLKIGGVSVEEIINIDSESFARSNNVTTVMPHEITACTARFSILPLP